MATIGNHRLSELAPILKVPPEPNGELGYSRASIASANLIIVSESSLILGIVLLCV
jgi:hypothetical protein